MMDKKKIFKKLLRKPLDWITMIPAVGGLVLGFGAWLVGAGVGLSAAIVLVLLLISSGVYVQRLLLGWDRNYEQLVNEWRAKVEQSREEELDDLYRELHKDGDPRTEALLKDLRTLTKALMSEQSDSLASGVFDIVTDVDKLFQRCVDYLKESLELWQTAESMERASIKELLMAQREVLVREVEQSLENLGKVLGRVKQALIHSSDRQQLAELREELSSRLRVAEEVEEKIRSMRDHNSSAVSARDEETYLRHAV